MQTITKQITKGRHYYVEYKNKGFAIVVDRSLDKKEVIKEKMMCSDCLSERHYILERDHIIPCMIGGAFLENNIQLLCSKCHKRKTLVDRKFLSYCRTKKIGGGKSISFWYDLPMNEIHSLYKEFFNEHGGKIIL